MFGRRVRVGHDGEAVLTALGIAWGAVLHDHPASQLRKVVWLVNGGGVVTRDLDIELEETGEGVPDGAFGL